MFSRSVTGISALLISKDILTKKEVAGLMTSAAADLTNNPSLVAEDVRELLNNLHKEFQV